MSPPVGSKAVVAEQLTDTLRRSPDELPVNLASVNESSLQPPRSSKRELSSAARGAAHAEAALTACGHAEADLGALIRTIQLVASTLRGAAETKETVRHEVECVQSLLLGVDEEQRSLEQSVSILQQTLDRAERDASRDRRVLVDETDAFIARLCDEHEATVIELERRLARLEVREDAQILGLMPPASNELFEVRLREAEAEIARLTQDRETARHSISRLEAACESAEAALVFAMRERDQLRTELLGSRSSDGARGIAFRDTVRVTQTPPGKIAVTPPEQQVERERVTKSAGDRALEPRPPSLSSKPPLPRKPDASTRPLIGYSLAGDSVPEDQKPPRGPGTPER